MSPYRPISALALLMMAAAGTPAAQAQTEGLPTFQDPPVLQPQPDSKTPAREGSRNLVLNITTALGSWKIHNPASGRDDPVLLRSYFFTPGTTHLAGPTIGVEPGKSIEVNFHNAMPDNSDLNCHHGDVHNGPHCFNTTNLHTHGLWISPSGNSDNVLIDIEPGGQQHYQFDIPPDHPAGTFWYHAHRHGSTAMQVSSGMAGALLIVGSRRPTKTANGDLDTLIPVDRFENRVVMLQQVQYYCRDSRGIIKKNPDGTYLCEGGDTGQIDNYDEFGPRKWATSGRYTSINGLIMPVFPVFGTNKIERWRVIHAGVRDTVNLQFRKLREGAHSPARLTVQQHQAYIDQNCTGKIVPQFLVASDGMTLSKVVKRDEAVFQPGYRWDMLLNFPEQGNYCILDQEMPAGTTVARAEHSRRLLGMVQVTSGQPVVEDPTAYLKQRLIESAQANMPADVRAEVISGLNNGLSLAKFTPHPDVGDGEVDGYQTMVFNIVNPTSPDAIYQVDGRPYDPDQPRILPLGGVQEWTLSSDFAGHPYHIHVNPFQIVKILDPSGRDVSIEGAVDDADGGKIDPQYPGLKGMWKDTLWIKNFLPANSGKPPEEGRYKVFIRTRYQRYTGDFVLHCHILDHEDLGMMERVRIAEVDK